MGGRDYVLRFTSEASELERLRALEEAADPLTHEHLDRTGVAAGWRCLEVGAGAGSVARWLGERVAPGGTVVATDIEPRFLVDLPSNVEVRKHDIRTDEPLGGPFDLVHCRAFLMHMPDPGAVLDRLVAAVRPGGWVVAEEADTGLTGFHGHPDAEWATGLMQEIFRRYTDTTTFDNFFGRKLPGLFLRAGLADVDARGTTRLSHDGDPALHRQRLSILNLRAKSAALGFSEEDLERLQAVVDSDRMAMFGTTLVAAWGRKPA